MCFVCKLISSVGYSHVTYFVTSILAHFQTSRGLVDTFGGALKLFTAAQRVNTVHERIEHSGHIRASLDSDNLAILGIYSNYSGSVRALSRRIDDIMFDMSVL